MADEEIKKKIREILKRGPMTALEISKEIKKDKKTLNPILYRMEDVECIKTSGPPKWQLKSSSSSPTVATDSTTRLSDVPPSPSATLSASSGATPLKDTNNEELEERIAQILSTVPQSTPDIWKQLQDPTITMKDVKSILYNAGIAENTTATGQKPHWIKKESSRVDREVTVTTPKSTGTKLEVNGEPIYKKRESHDGTISFIRLTDENIGSEGGGEEVKSKPIVGTDSPGNGSSLPSNSSATVPPTEGMSSLSLSDTDLKEAVLNHLRNNKGKSFTAGHLKDLLNQPTRDKVLVVLQQLVKEGLAGENNDGTFNSLD